MAARRLAISDLLCDEPNEPRQNAAPQQPVEQRPSRPLPSQLASILNDPDPLDDPVSRQTRSEVSLTASVTRAPPHDVVPLSLQPVPLRRHTPSPSLRRDATLAGYAVPHAVQTHIPYDRDALYNEASRPAGAPSRSPEYDRVLAGRQQHSQVDSSHQLYPPRPHDPFATTFYPSARPSSSRSAHSDSPTNQPFSHSVSYQAHPHSPSASRSPSSVYSLPLPQRQPSHSPALSARPDTASPVSYFRPPSRQTPPYPSPHTHYDPVRSSLRGPAMVGPSSPSMLFSGSPPSSLLPTSESRTPSLPHGSPREVETRMSAASLPNILNSPSPSMRAGAGLGGLEVLVQAATEERRRLSGELGPGLSRVDSSPRLSRSPVMERASVQPIQPPVSTVYTKPLSPLAVRTPSGTRRDILNDVPVSPSHTRDLEGEPPRKRHKSSDPTSYPPPMAVHRPVAPPPEVVAFVSAHLLQGAASTVTEKSPGADSLHTTTIPVAPHEAGGSTSDSEAVEARPAPILTDTPLQATVEEQILDAVDVNTARTDEKEKGKEREEKAREKKKREQKTKPKTKEKRSTEHKSRPDPIAREVDRGAKDQDAHEWLLEHYASASPKVDPVPASSDKAAESPTVAAPPAPTARGVKPEDGSRGRHHSDGHGAARSSKATKKARSRTPTPLAMLEEELDGVLPAARTTGFIEDDLVLDLASSAVASSVGGAPVDDNDMDVDNELLSLLDDAPPASHSSRSKPTTITRLDVHARTKSSQPGSERGSMPPPASPLKDGGKFHSAKAADKPDSTGAVAGHKKKDASQKPVTKPRAPPKPKPKAAASTTASKSKPKAIKDAVASAPSPTPGMLTPSTSTPSVKGKKSAAPSAVNQAAKRSASAAGGQSRSRSTSVMPAAPGAEGDGKPAGETAGVAEEKQQAQDDKLYCICKTRYDEDRAMIACDRCDEWYHTQCVNMPDLEIDLVDQFICPQCVENNPHLRLQTTYKKRCFNGLKHLNPVSPGACHRPARGTYSKYCSDDCGIMYMQSRIHAWRGDRDSLWESVKEARKREGVVVLVKDGADGDAKAEGNGHPSPAFTSAQPVLEVVKPSRSKVERETERLNGLLDKISLRRDELKKEMDVVLWREKLIELAAARAEQLDECGWDQRLCFGEEEYAEFGTSVLESYEEAGQTAGDAMQVDGAQVEEGEWWCRGQKKCARHAGWQKLRSTEVECDTEALDGALFKLTTQEREIRKRIEDVMHPTARASGAEPEGPTVGSPLQPLDGKTTSNGHSKPKANGDTVKKGKKKKI